MTKPEPTFISSANFTHAANVKLTSLMVRGYKPCGLMLQNKSGDTCAASEGGQVFWVGKRPVHPGEVFREDFFVPEALTAAYGDNKGGSALLDGLDKDWVGCFMEESVDVTPAYAKLLSANTGTSVEFWTFLQAQHDETIK